MAQAQTVSINKIRADAVLVTRGFFMLYWVRWRPISGVNLA
jgi:hypothetical protein